MSKILLALQYWSGDRDKAMQLARLIADLEPRFSTTADFMFMSRFDCAHDPETVAYVGRKFNVHTHVNRGRRGVGWPHGCNELWFGTMDHVYDLNVNKRMPTYKAILTFESDGYPLRPDWIPRLIEAWDSAKVKVLGAMQTSPGKHVNGNAMFSGDTNFLHEIGRKIGGCSPHGGWDYVLAPKFQKMGWKDCPLMRSWWTCPSMDRQTFDSLVEQGVVFFHGVKDDSVLKHVRERFL